MKPTQTLRIFALTLLLLLAACAGPGKPTVKLSATPAALEDGQTLTLKADASGGKGPLKVQFSKGSEVVGEDDSSPYELSLPITSGDDATLAFSAKVIGSDGNSAISEAVSVSVKVDKEAPKVSLAASSSNLNAAGSVTLTASATDNKGVVKVEFFKGAEKLGEDVTPADGFSLVVNLSAEDNGSLNYTAKAYDKKGNVGTSAEVSVSVDIDEVAPNISLSANKTSVTTAGSVTLSADASDNKGISKVEFLEGENKLGEDTEAPYTFELNFTAAHNGNHSYTAKAFDTNNNSASSDSLTLQVDIDATLPVVSLSSDNTYLSEAGSITLTADASDDKGVSKVEFYQGDSKLSEDTEAPYTHSLSLNATHNGPHIYKAKAYDSNGNSAVSDLLTVNVDIDITPPTIALATNKNSVITAGSVILTADASDNKGVSKVEFYKVQNDGGLSLLAETNQAPFTHSIPFTHTDNGSYSYKAKAFDAKGNNTTSQAINIVVDIDATLPAVTLSSDNTTVSEAGSITLSATATDDKGVTKVEFYEGTTLLATKNQTNPPSSTFTHSISYTAANNGNHSYYAKAYDDNNSAPSDPLDITVDIDVIPPIVSVVANPSSLDATGTMVLTATASDNKSVSKVEFYKGTEFLGNGTLGESGYTKTVDYTGSYNATDTFTAKAFDPSGNHASATVEVVIDIDITPPILDLLPDVTKRTSPGMLTLFAASSDNRKVTKLEFYRVKTPTNELLQTINDPAASAQISIPMTPDDNGIHKFLAKAYDAKGNTASSGEVSVEVEIKPNILFFRQATTHSTSISLGDTGGTVDLEWDGEYVLDYSLEVSPNEATASINTGGNTAGKVVLPRNTSNTDKTYTVTLKAKSFGTPPLGDDTQTLSITVAKDTTPPTVTLESSSTNVSATGSITLTANPSDASGISKVEFYKGTTLLGTDNEGPDYKQTVDYSTSYNATDTFMATAFDLAGNEKSASVEVVVDIDIDAPSLNLSSNPTQLTAPGSITLTAASSDNRKVTKLEFYKDSTDNPPIHNINDPVASAIHQLSLAAVDNGTPKFIAKAYDAKGNTTTAEVSVAVAIAPNITEFKAAQGSNLALTDAGGSVNLEWTAQQAQSYTVEVTPAPTSSNVNGTTATVVVPTNLTNATKTYSVKLTAKAYGTGIADDIETLSITVAPDTTLPTVSLAPVGTVTNTNPIILTVTASDASGISKVEFYEGNTLLSTDSTGGDGYTYSTSYTEANNGPHVYTAKAFDNNGNTKDSDPTTVTVNIDTIPPTVMLLPVGSVTKTDTSPITLEVSASDASGISKVEFYEGSTLLATINQNNPPSTSVTHNITYTAANNGSHSYHAKVFDANNLSAVSSTFSVNLQIPPSITSFTQDKSQLNGFGGAVGFNWSAANANNYSLTVFSPHGVSEVTGLPSNPTSSTSSLVTLPPNPTANPVTYTFTLTANGYGGVAGVSQNRIVSVMGGGILRFSVSGLPAGVGSDLYLSGVVDGAVESRVITGTGTVDIILPPSQYALSGKFVGVGLDTYRPTLSASSATIVAGQTTTVNVTYSKNNLKRQPIAASNFHTLAIRSDGTVAAWGYGGGGRTSVPAGLTNVVAVAAGTTYSMALKSDGTVVAWGSNAYGPVSPSLGRLNVVSISAGFYHGLALLEDGTLRAWGDNIAGQSSVPTDLRDGSKTVVAISANGMYSQALLPDGTVRWWGENGSNANVQTNDTANKNVAISAGHSHSLTLRLDGTVVQKGDTGNNQGSVPVGLSGVTAIAAGYYHNLVLKSNGTVVSWGGASGFNLGIIPSALTGATVVAIAAGNNYNLALKNDGTLVGWGDNSDNKATPPSGLTVLLP